MAVEDKRREAKKKEDKKKEDKKSKKSKVPPAPVYQTRTFPLPPPFEAPVHSLLSSLNSPEQYLEYSIESFKTATVVNSMHVDSFNMWGFSLYRLARIIHKKDNKIFKAICAEAQLKFDQALKLE